MRARKNDDYKLLRQTYDGGLDNFQRDLRACNKDTKSTKFLRSTVNGNINDFIPKKNNFTGSYVGDSKEYEYQNQGFTSPTENTASSLKPGYKVD